MYLYYIIEDELTFENANYITYGIKVMFSDFKKTSELFRIPDISTDYDLIIDIASLCTQEQLDPMHLIDILQDIL